MQNRNETRRPTPPAAADPVELAHDPDAYGAFCGAVPFSDGVDPLFAEVAFARPVTGEAYGPTRYGGRGTLVLDAGGDPDGDPDVPTLTLNLQADDGSVAAFVRAFRPLSHPAAGRSFAQAWAETFVPATGATREGLEALGFRFEEF